MTHRVETVVVGAGITGLVAAWTLARQDRQVVLIESSNRAGGLIHTTHRDRFLLEHGPFTILPKAPVFRRILEYAARDLEIVTADPRAKARRFVLQRGRLVPIHGRLGPLSTPLYGVGAKARIIAGLCWSRCGSGEDTSIFEAVSRRFGKAFATWAVDPLIRGIVSGDCRALSLNAMFPPAGKLDQRIRSPLAAVARSMIMRPTAPQAELAEQLEQVFPLAPGQSPLTGMRRSLISFREGLESLPTWIARQLGDRLRLATTVTEIAPCSTGYLVRARTSSGEESSPIEWATRRVVLTTPVRPTARLLQAVAPEAAKLLESIRSASLAVVHLGFRRTDTKSLPDGFGFLVPSIDRESPILGALFASRTFAHHAPRDCDLLRVFLGGTSRPELATAGDDVLEETALRGVRNVLGLTGAPILVHIDRFVETIPQYALGHLDRLAALERAIRTQPGLILAGSYRDGVSVNDRAVAGFQAARECIAQRADDGGP